MTVDQVEQRRQAIALLLAADPTLSQRDLAKAVGASQKTISRDLAAMSQAGDSASEDVPQPVSRQPSDAGRLFREAMDAELARVSGILGGALQWNTGEREVLATIASDLDRRAELQAALAACEDLGSPRALKLAQEIRLLGVGIARLVKGIQAEVSKLVRQHQPEPEQPSSESVVSMKARRAANTRWTRERLRQQASEAQVRDPGETG